MMKTRCYYLGPQNIVAQKTQKLIFLSPVIVLINGSRLAGSALLYVTIQRPSSFHLYFSVILSALFLSAWSKLDLCHVCISAV